MADARVAEDVAVANPTTHTLTRPIQIPVPIAMPAYASASAPANAPVIDGRQSGGHAKTAMLPHRSHGMPSSKLSAAKASHSPTRRPPPLPSRIGMLQTEMCEVRDALRAQPHACDIRLLIFATAASEEGYERTLVPVPPQFKAAVGSGCDVDRLRSAVSDNWPSCRLMLEILSADEHYAALETDDVDAFHLLHWLLVASPSCPTLRRVSGLHLRCLCRVLGLARPTQPPGQVMSICYERGGTPIQRGDLQRASPGPKASFAYLGLPFNQVYRFLATGRYDSMAGEPVRLYAQPESALIHCYDPSPQQFRSPTPAPAPSPASEANKDDQPGENTNKKNSKDKDKDKHKTKDKNKYQNRKGKASSQTGDEESFLCWPHSILSEAQQALVVCQLPTELDESIAHSPEKHFLEFFVQDSATLRPCYLLLFDEPVAAEMMLSWPGRRVEAEKVGPSLAERSRDRIMGWARFLGARLGAIKRVMAAF
ncbi:uncharacterized protein Dana_GF21313 [Drosophila ananassae]|uniref:PARP16 N-terminal domain-containing protein n=1 Tax=Drosophila ananassae TaxID=7217 RepID=B3MRM1_DROAN|nr:uncharacterized protein LOC6503997 [Drosophila ananassae]EDV34426.1 uncharacterized protein Dana_GF21313 [Drosophila ananassae]